MSSAKKRKIDHECRVFNDNWTRKYFFANFNGRAVCLICRDAVAVFKEFNLKRHFQSKHSDFGRNLNESELHGKAENLVQKLKHEQTFFVKQSAAQEAATMASFVISHKIVKHSKAFSEGEFFKDCMIAVSDILCPESKKKFESISLSRRTVVRRIECISEDLTDQLGIRIKSLLWYSLALDESTDISDTAQLLIFFIR